MDRFGSEAVHFFSDKFDVVVGIDNDGRSYFFGPEPSSWNVKRLAGQYSNYVHFDVDIRRVAARAR